jgi:methyl-accepting chemotaxis protein
MEVDAIKATLGMMVREVEYASRQLNSAQTIVESAYSTITMIRNTSVNLGSEAIALSNMIEAINTALAELPRVVEGTNAYINQL